MVSHSPKDLPGSRLTPDRFSQIVYNTGTQNTILGELLLLIPDLVFRLSYDTLVCYCPLFLRPDLTLHLTRVQATQAFAKAR